MPAADVYRSLWRHRGMIVLLTVLAGVAAFAFTRMQPKIYQANALVRIQQAAPSEAYGSLGSLELGQRLAQTYATIVGTGSMRVRVAKLLEEKVPLEDISISGTPVGNIELLTISAKSEQPAVAAQVANATTIALRRFIKETGTLRDQIVVVDSASTPVVPVSPRTKLVVALVVVLALIFNGALALGRDFFADRLPEIDEWHERFGHPVLATVPTIHLKAASDVFLTRTERERVAGGIAATSSAAGPGRWAVRTTESPRRGK